MNNGVKRSRGRPKTANPASERLPVVRVTASKLEAYRNLAQEIGVPVSEWIRVNLDASIGESREQFVQKRRQCRINSIETDRYYLFKIPGNYRTLGFVLRTDGEHVEFRPHVTSSAGDPRTGSNQPRLQRVHKNQIIDVVPASKQMLQSAEDQRI